MKMPEIKEHKDKGGKNGSFLRWVYYFLLLAFCFLFLYEENKEQAKEKITQRRKPFF